MSDSAPDGTSGTGIERLDRQPSILCTHIAAGPYPFETLLVLDDHLGPTESLIRCTTCGTVYLLEMLDWLADLRLFRVRLPEPEAAAGLLRDLQRGSCDLKRAGEEARHFSLTSERLAVLMLLNTGQAELVRLIGGAAAMSAPGGSWRELPCDGTWIRTFC